MATLVETVQTPVELELLSDDNDKATLRVPPAALGGPANATIGQPTPLIGFETDEARIQPLPKGRSVIVTIQLAGINFITSFSGGLVTVGLPAMSASLGLPPHLLLWPMNSYALTSGACLLLAGAIADVIGTRKVNLIGCFFIGLFIMVSGFSQTGIQLILFRAMQGIAGAMALPSSMSIISRSIESGKPRNIAFACLGLAMPLGFSFGLVLSGVFIAGPGWRVGFYVGGAASFLLFAIGIWALPPDVKVRTETSIRKRLITEIDWLGAGIACTSIAIFSYVLATLSAELGNIKQPITIVLLIFSILLLPAFAMWMNRQERKNKPALIPNSLWKKTSFTTVCLLVLLSTAVTNCMELFSSLFFQEVQGKSALQASLRILPNMTLGIFTNFFTGYFVNRVPAIYAILITSVLCSGAPLLMAIINPEWPYWYDAFFAQLLSPLAADVLFTIGILIISDVFPARTQALAGAVFNTLAQLGTSIGLTTTSVISVVVTKESRFARKSSPDALLEGYRASFWTLFAWAVLACFLGAFGLRKVGKVGEKRD